MFILYNFLLTLSSFVWFPLNLLKLIRNKQLAHWREFCGIYKIPRKSKQRIWLHCVSLGELIPGQSLIKEIKSKNSNVEIILTTSKLESYETAKNKFADNYDYLFYFPLDVLRFQLSAAINIRADIVILFETEFWMNFLWASKMIGAKTILVNGRLCESHYRGIRWILPIYRKIIEYLDYALMRSELDAQRIKITRAKNVEVLGDCKFDQALEYIQVDPNKWREKLGINKDQTVIVIGSTRNAFEENFILEALEKVGIKDLTIIHAPRNLPRVPELYQKVTKIFGSCALRSKGESGNYIILDTYAELNSVYSIADIVIIGGSFSNIWGGQNIIQPMALGKPTLHGIYMQNWTHVTELISKFDGYLACATPQELTANIQRLLADPQLAKNIGSQSYQCIKENAGACERYAQKVLDQLVETKELVSR